MATLDKKLRTVPYVCDSAAEAVLDGLSSEVLALVTGVIERVLVDAPVARIDISSSSEPGDSSGWREAVFTVLLNSSESQAFDYWYRIEEEIESEEARLSPEALKQLAEQVAIRVHPIAPN